MATAACKPPSFVSEVAYCLELCTLKLVKFNGVNRIPSEFVDAFLNFASLENPDSQNWTQVDSRRGEHIIHSLANIIRLDGIETDRQKSMSENIFKSYIGVSVPSGAPKIRWNTVLALDGVLRKLDTKLVIEMLCDRFCNDPYFKVII